MSLNLSHGSRFDLGPARPSEPEPLKAPQTPTLTALGLLSLAELFDRDRELALQLADENARAHWAEVERGRDRHLVTPALEAMDATGRTC
jgi:hypothetical protein